MSKTPDGPNLNDIPKTVQFSSAVWKSFTECCPEDSQEFLFSNPEDVGAQVSHYIERMVASCYTPASRLPRPD